MTEIATAPQIGLPPPPDLSVGTWDVIGAGWTAETIRTDAWGYARKVRREIALDLHARLPDDARARIAEAGLKPGSSQWDAWEQRVIEEVARASDADPGNWADAPRSYDDLIGAVDKRRKAELDEAEGILSLPNASGLAAFAGAAARGMTDPISIAMLPLGLGGSAARIIASEALLGAAGEAAILPREFEVARELELENPDVLARIATGAALGGALSAGVIGASRVVQRMRLKKLGLDTTLPDGADPVTFAAEVAAQEARLRGDATVDEELAVPPPMGDVEPGTLTALLVAREAATAPIPATRWLDDIQSLLPARAGRPATELLDLRKDPRVVAELAARTAAAARAELEARNLASGPAELLLADAFGTRAAVTALTAPLDTPVVQFVDPADLTRLGAVRFEGRGLASMTAGELRRWSLSEMRGTLDPAVFRDRTLAATPTTRSFTRDGQIMAGNKLRVDVAYEVVELSTLRGATGDIQPRDRSLANSAVQVREIAAGLDPAQLMPAPNAAQGTPIVGADNVIDSGNGRTQAIALAYRTLPDRAAAYRQAIEDAGFAIPEGVTEPVLIARRLTDLDPAQRAEFAALAQDAGVARMRSEEIAAINRRAMTPEVMAAYVPGKPIIDAANKPWLTRVLAALPATERNAMFDAGGALNAAGRAMVREALFARAWPDPDILRRFVDAEPGELRGLMDALDRAAPAMATLRAEIDAGLVRPEFDISGHVLDAARMIALARDMAARENGGGMAQVLREMLDDVDLIEGPVAPLTARLVGVMWRGGRAAPADEVAAFLTRYADEARTAGKTGTMFPGPSPREVLQTIAPDRFADLPEHFGAVRGFARPEAEAPSDAPAAATPAAPDPAVVRGYDNGAASPEAVAADAALEADLRGPDADAPPPAAARAADTTPDTTAAEAAAAARFDARRAEAAQLRELDALARDFADAEIEMPDGTKVTARDILDDLKADTDLDDVIVACNPKGAAA